jgi:hypothetical protein
MVPFMNTGLLVGPVAKALDGADLSFYVGFVVAAAVCLSLHKLVVPNPAVDLGEIEKPHIGVLDTA